MLQHDETSFFEAFDAALTGDPEALAPWLVQPAPGLGVYRNTIVTGAVDALAATFSTVELMVGAAWFRAAAGAYATANPPEDPALMSYGAGFPAWLATFPPAADTPYLPAIAELDWLWWQCWSAADAPAPDPGLLAQLPSDSLDAVTLGLHPTLRLAEFDCGIPSLWLGHQAPQGVGTHVLAATDERILFIRAGLDVRSHLIDAGTHAFLQALQRGTSLLAAAERALAADPACSLPDILSGGIALGLFTTVNPAPDPQT